MPLSNDTWKSNISGDWATAADWSTGTVPNSNDDAIISTASIQTITHNGGDDTVHSLTVGDDHFVMNGGTLSFLAGASFGFDYRQNGGGLLGAGAVTISQNGYLLGGFSQGTLNFAIGGTIALANYTLGGSTTLTNNATTNQTAQIAIGDVTGVNATITNNGTYTINGDYGIAQGAATAKFTNAGTLQKTAGSGASFVDVNVASTGTISVVSGTLDFRGPSNSFAGTISGAGQFAIGGGGSHTIAAGISITASAFSIVDNGTTVTLGGNLTYANTFSQSFGSTLNLNGHALTLSGPAAFFNAGFNTPVVNGSGALNTSGATNVDVFVLGGTVTWTNSGTVTQNGQNQIGDASANAANVDNNVGAQFNIANDTNLERGSSAASLFTNQGTLAKTGGSGASFVDVDVASAGTISVVSGTLEFRGPVNTFGGTIGGAGQFAIGGGSSNTISSGASITGAAFSIVDTGTTVTLGGDLSYAKTFSQTFGSTLNLNGHTLTLSGPASFSNAGFNTPVVDGSGTLATSDATTADVFVLGGSVNWTNTGTVTQNGQNQIGDASSNAASFTNQAAGQFNIVNDTNLERGSATTSLFSNAGTLAKTGGTGVSFVDVSVASTGTISAASGTLDFRGPINSFAGTISGAGQFAIGGGSANTIANATTVSVATFDVFDNGTSLNLLGNLTYAGAFNQGYGTNINLNGHLLTLSGAADFFNANFATPTISGSGTVADTAATTWNDFVLGGTVNWRSNGVVSAVATNFIGDSGVGAATYTNLGGGQFNITNDSNLERGAATNSLFSNGGLLAKTGGVGTSFVDVDYSGAGKIDVASGVLDFRGLADAFSGAIGGAGQFALGGGGQDTIASGATINSATFDIYDNATSVTLGENLAFAGAFNQGDGSAVNLAGFTLTLSGAASFFNGGFATPDIGGAGTLATSGSTSLNGFVLGGAVNWSNTGTASEIATTQIGDSSTNAATLTNQGAGKIFFVNDSGFTRGVATTSSIVNVGSIVKSGGTGVSSIAVNVNNTGVIESKSGSIDLTGAVTGTGTLKIDAGAKIEVASTVAAGTTANFAASTGTFAIDNLGAFAGVVTGFSAGDAVDLVNQSVKTIQYSGAVVTVTFANNTVHTLSLSGGAATLAAVSDGFGGTDIVAAANPFTLTSGADIVAASTAALTVNGTAATVNSGDSLVGGSALDTLALSGGGAFNLGALAAFSLDKITLAAGANYNLTLGPVDVAAGQALSVNAFAVGAANSVAIDGSALGAGSSLSLTGGAGADTLIGGAGNNAFNGDGGADTMTGGAGHNTYVFSTALNAATNDPTITNFNVATDKIDLSHTIFTALTAGALPAADFAIGASATTTSQHILYNSATGALLYDPDGSGAQPSVQFAHLSTGLALTAADFKVV